LRYLLRAYPLPGEIQLSYEREPNFWAGEGIAGPTQQTMIVRAKDGRAVGMGSRAVRTLYVNGEPQPVGYMSQMRVDPEFAWGVALPKVLTQGWRFFRELHQDTLAPYYLVSLVMGDSVAWRMMTLGLPEWPVLHAVGGLLTYGITVRRAHGVPRLGSGMRLRRATEDDRAAIGECLARNNRRRQFAPQWEAASLGDGAVTPDLSLPDFWLVERGTQVVSRWYAAMVSRGRICADSSISRHGWGWHPACPPLASRYVMLLPVIWRWTMTIPPLPQPCSQRCTTARSKRGTTI
jgi:hypothetical protein